MRTKLYFVAALAATMLASCADDKFVGENSPNVVQNESTETAINIGGGFKAVTRADYLGKAAANKLDGKFIVGGFKDNGTTVTEVFDDYIVQWEDNSAGKTESNTSDWEYVGITAAAPSSIAGNTQAIKYWDYASTQYDFAAYSTSDFDAAKLITDGSDWSSGKLKVSPITKASASVGPTYTIQGNLAELENVYISNLATHYKATYTGKPKFQDEVLLTFRNLTCKARVALYETIPGYSVKDVKFYTDNNTPALGSATATSATLFAPNTLATDVFYTSGIATVTFPTRGSDNISNSDYNLAHVGITSGTTSETVAFGDLNYTAEEDKESTGNYYLARHSNAPTFANGTKTNNYIPVMPNETGTVLELRIDYTLVPIDGSSETIKVNGATAYVPAHFAAWKSNFAYTYIFKISDNTNGWTSTTTTDPKGLFPITFDAVVVETEDHEQTTITTVAIPTITTYQVGHDYDAQETYKAGDIYIQAMNNNNTPATLMNLSTDDKFKLYIVTGTNANSATEADIMDALNIRKKTDGSIYGRNGLILTEATSGEALILSGPSTFTSIPAVDGNTISVNAGEAGKFSAVGGKVYAFVYEGEDGGNSTIISYVSLSGSTQPDDWTGNYYDKNDPTCSGPAKTDLEYAAGDYYRKYTNSNITYGVKVIKVAAGS